MAKKTTDQDLNLKDEARHGKQVNQKVKPYIVLQYLLKMTDDEHTQTATEICAYLQECGISAERRSIYRDIEEINKVSLMLEENCTIFEAEEMLLDDEDDEKYTISEMQKELPCCAELTNQKISALVKQLCLDNALTRIEDKRKAYFSKV